MYSLRPSRSHRWAPKTPRSTPEASHMDGCQNASWKCNAKQSIQSINIRAYGTSNIELELQPHTIFKANRLYANKIPTRLNNDVAKGVKTEASSLQKWHKINIDKTIETCRNIFNCSFIFGPWIVSLFWWLWLWSHRWHYVPLQDGFKTRRDLAN